MLGGSWCGKGPSCGGDGVGKGGGGIVGTTRGRVVDGGLCMRLWMSSMAVAA